MRPDFETLVKTPILVQPESGAAKTGDGCAGIDASRQELGQDSYEWFEAAGRHLLNGGRAAPAATTATVRSFGHFSVWINRYYGDRESAGLPVENLQRGQFLRLKIIVYNDLAYQFLPFGPIPTPGMNADLHEHLHSLAQPMIFMKIRSCL